MAAINTAHNQVSSDISLAQASADQKIVQSKRAVEIQTLQAQAEVQPIKLLAEQLAQLRRAGPGVLEAYIRNVKLKLFEKVERNLFGCEGVMMLSPFLAFGAGHFSCIHFLIAACACCSSRLFGFYTIVEERTCRVYVLFGKVIGHCPNRACISSPVSGSQCIHRQSLRPMPCARSPS